MEFLVIRAPTFLFKKSNQITKNIFLRDYIFLNNNKEKK